MQQIVRLYEFFEADEGQHLLQVQASTEDEQRFFEDLYGQITYLKALRNATSEYEQQAGGGAQRVPRPIQRIITGVTSFHKYSILKNDLEFMTRFVKVCDGCFSAVR